MRKVARIPSSLIFAGGPNSVLFRLRILLRSGNQVILPTLSRRSGEDVPMPDREELRATAARCLALACSATDPRKLGHSDWHGPEALRDGRRPAKRFREAATRVQRPANDAAASGAAAADNAATTANPTKRKVGRLSWWPRPIVMRARRSISARCAGSTKTLISTKSSTSDAPAQPHPETPGDHLSKPLS